MRTLNGQPIPDEALQAHAGAMFDTLQRIADHSNWEDSADPASDMCEAARAALAPCHFFRFEVPTGGIACTDPEDMPAEAFEAWLGAIPEHARQDWRARRWLRNRAKGYIAGLHNADKRRYAVEWLAWRTGKREDSPRASTITAAQAESARREIDACLTEPPPKGPATIQPLLMALDPFTQPVMAF